MRTQTLLLIFSRALALSRTLFMPIFILNPISAVSVIDEDIVLVTGTVLLGAVDCDGSSTDPMERTERGGLRLKTTGAAGEGNSCWERINAFVSARDA